MPLTQMQLLNLHMTLALPSHAPVHHHKCCPLLIDLLIVQVQHLEFQMDKANSAWLEQDFIDARNQDQSVTTSDFHKQLTVGALLFVVLVSHVCMHTMCIWNLLCDMPCKSVLCLDK